MYTLKQMYQLKNAVYQYLFHLSKKTCILQLYEAKTLLWHITIVFKYAHYFYSRSSLRIGNNIMCKSIDIIIIL